MPNRGATNVITHRRERLAVALMLIDVMRVIAKRIDSEEKFGSVADVSMLYLAVYVGQAEGLPPTAYKVSLFTGISRPTTIRKLSALVSNGVMRRDAQGRHSIAPEVLNSPIAVDDFRRIVASVRAASDVLSKMDNLTMA